MARNILQSYILTIGIVAGFWIADIVLVAFMDTQVLTTLLIRNVVLASFALMFTSALPRIASNHATSTRRLVFVLLLWLFGTVIDEVRLLSAGMDSIEGAFKAMLFFPLNTLSIATYSGILPALLIVTIAALAFGWRRSSP